MLMVNGVIMVNGGRLYFLCYFVALLFGVKIALFCPEGEPGNGFLPAYGIIHIFLNTLYYCAAAVLMV